MKLLASQWAGSWEVYHRKRLHLTSKIIKRKCHCPTHNDISLNKKICKRNQNDYIGHLFIKFAILLVSSSRMLVWSTADLMNSIGEKNLPRGLPGVRSLENLYGWHANVQRKRKRKLTTPNRRGVYVVPTWLQHCKQDTFSFRLAFIFPTLLPFLFATNICEK